MESRSKVSSETAMPKWSRYAGQAIDLSSRRSIKIDSPGDCDAIVERCTKEIVVDNFYHLGRFWRGAVPLDSVEHIFGQAFNFSRPRTRKRQGQIETIFNAQGLPKYRLPVLNHVQVRFTLQSHKPVRLYPLESEISGDPDHLIDDFVYSVEILGPAGVSFNLRDGLAGNLLAAHRFLSTQEMVFERLVVENKYVTESPPLPLNARERQDLLIASLLRSHEAGLTEAYYLFRVCGTNNCTSGPFSILDNVLKYRWPQRWGAMLYRLPLNPRMYLRARGLDSNPSERKLVRCEFADYIDDPETQARKRDHVKRLAAMRRASREAGGLRRNEEAGQEPQ